MEGWQEEGQTLIKTFTFKSYLKVMGFVNAVAWEANRLNHHPDLVVSFNQCKVMLTTHDKGMITDKDRDLAKKIDALYAN